MLGEYRRRVRICRDWWQRCLKNGELPPAGPARGVFVLMCLRTGWYANTVTARGSRRRGIWPGNLDNTQGSRNQATQDMENVTLNGPQCKTQNTIPLPPPQPLKPSQEATSVFFFPIPSTDHTTQAICDLERLTSSDPSAAVRQLWIPRTLAIQQLRPTSLPSGRRRPG